MDMAEEEAAGGVEQVGAAAAAAPHIGKFAYSYSHCHIEILFNHIILYKNVKHLSNHL